MDFRPDILNLNLFSKLFFTLSFVNILFCSAFFIYLFTKPLVRLQKLFKIIECKIPFVFFEYVIFLNVLGMGSFPQTSAGTKDFLNTTFSLTIMDFYP